ncbi:MAG: PhoH family protein [Planctomycetes bacterium]|nr:PhoH family protein [Planctomycetota bacterium]MBI3847462.1 PhoH family protein [Planctomycetota bacterium]
MEKVIRIADIDEERRLLGKRDRNVKVLRDLYDVKVTSRNGVVKITGEEAGVRDAVRAIQTALERLRSREDAGDDEIESILRRARDGSRDEKRPTDEGETDGDSFAGLGIRPRTPGQGRYVEALAKSEIVVAIGPAGTGKTYLAVAMAVQCLRHGRVRRIVLARPAVEAGEKLGFLPGDLQAKVNPYLRPLYDALNDILEFGQLRRYMEREIVEIVPLAYMRGRTLDHSFIILDEAQNTTPKQMKMFLTRMGRDSRIVVTGDVTQIDLPEPTESGLVHAERVLGKVRGLDFVYLDREDIVRHPLVQRIVDAYGAEDGEAE